MSLYRIASIQGGNAAQSAPPAPPARPAQPGQTAPTRDQLREQIRQTIQDATRAAQDARDPMEVSVDRQGVSIRDGRPVIFGEHQPPGMPGIAVRRGGAEDVIPPQAVDISIAFFIMVAVIIIGLPIARAIGRRLERRGQLSTGADPALGGQLQRIEQAVEAMSIEIERISESQRFMAKLQNGAAPERAVLTPGERR